MAPKYKRNPPLPHFRYLLSAIVAMPKSLPLLSFSLLVLILSSQACGKYLLKLASNTINLWRIHGVESLLRAILLNEVICSSFISCFHLL